MPSLTFTATGQLQNGIVDLVVEFADGRTLRRTVTAGKIDSPTKLAAWVLGQTPDAGADVPSLRRAFTVDYHLEQRSFGDGKVDVPVVDTVRQADSVEDAAWAKLLTSPLGQVTVEQALAAIDATTTVVQLRGMVRSLAQAVIAMRDAQARSLEIQRRRGQG